MPSSAKVRPCAWAVASWKYRLLAAWAFVACAEASEPPATGPLIELPLLAPIDPTKPFNHSAEATLVANGGHVAVAATQLHLDSETSFGTTNLLRKVAVIASHDRGERFGAAMDPGGGPSTSDPVLRAGEDGTFWLAALDTDHANSAIVAESDDQGRSFREVARGVATLDKEWLVVDARARALYIAAAGGVFRIAYDGAVSGSNVLAAYGESGCSGEGGAVFAVREAGTLHTRLLSYDGASEPVLRGPVIDAGDAAVPRAAAAASLGRTLDGGYFLVHTFRSAVASEVRLLLRATLDEAGTELSLSRPSKIAFHPAAAIDAAGRLHAIWYESDGPTGMLVYVRSKSARFQEGFSEPRIIDPQACPGGGFYPGEADTEPTGGRRLREYIDIAIDGSRAHFAWTHAPVAPSRVYTSYRDFEP